MTDDTKGPSSGPGVMLVAIDGSSGAVHALRWAADRALRSGAHLRVMTAWEPAALLGLPAASVVAPSEAELASLGNQLLDEGLAEIEVDLPGGVSRAVRHDRPGKAILDEIVHSEPDLVVVGSHGHSALTRVLLGSVSTHVAAHASCPVVIVPETAEIGSSDNVRVGYDGSAGARAAVDWVVHHTACPIEIVHTWQLSSVFRSHQLTEAEVVDAAVKAVEAVVEELPEQVRSRVTTRIEQGEPRQVLLEGLGARSALVVGRRPTSPVASLLGSVSTYVASHAEVPVVIVPPPVE